MNERDSLTGLPTSRAGLAFLDDSVEHNSQVALLLCDVDRLMYVNAEFGHLRGDEELRRIARDLERVCAPSPVFRFGGDEFVIVLPEQSLEGAREVAARILASQPPVEILATSVGRGTPIATLSFSIGIALFPTHALSAEKLLHAADIALLKAKDGGRLPDGTAYSGRNRAMAWGDFLDEFLDQSAQFLNSDFKS